jgi:hypothetical protein
MRGAKPKRKQLKSSGKFELYEDTRFKRNDG